MTKNTWHEMVRSIYNDAKASLGPTLGGGSPTDLIADNTSESLENIREALVDTGIQLEWEQAMQADAARVAWANR